MLGKDMNPPFTKHPWRLRDLSLSDVKKRKFEVAVLPMGATEPHNFHLPYGTDALEVEAVAERSSAAATKKGAKVVLLPTIPIGSNRSTMGFPLTLNLDHSTLFRIMEDVIESLETHKIYKLVIINGHGGNYLRPSLKDMYGRTKVFLSLINWWEVGSEIRPTIFVNKGEHADEMETSVMLYLYPELVNMKVAGKGTSKKSNLSGINERWVGIARPWHVVTSDSGHGDPHKATSEKGRKYFSFTVKKIAEYLVELSRTPLSKAFPY